jgi:hypothetical protein
MFTTIGLLVLLVGLRVMARRIKKTAENRKA